ncbi:hypothetical protein XENTR_v10006690 [Xenopus tropicalis]|nr:hypothetical protein XENTR_v10006690 [Xenopus tropicalis]
MLMYSHKHQRKKKNYTMFRDNQLQEKEIKGRFSTLGKKKKKNYFSLSLPSACGSLVPGAENLNSSSTYRLMFLPTEAGRGKVTVFIPLGRIGPATHCKVKQWAQDVQQAKGEEKQSKSLDGGGVTNQLTQ